jgi:sirohydrochlorin ferrochelatase
VFRQPFSRAPGETVELAFLEFMAPDLPACVARLIAEGAEKIVILPMFIAQGGHLKREVPEMLEKLRSTWPQVEFSWGGHRRRRSGRSGDGGNRIAQGWLGACLK